MSRMKPIKDFPNYSVTEEGHIVNNTTGHFLTPIIKYGYYGVRLSKAGKVTFKSLHLLVYDAFFGDRQKGMHIDHIDGVRTNNNILNLRQVTPEQNNSNRLHLNRGENVNTSKLTASQVMEIRLRRSKGESTKQLADDFGLAKSSVKRIINGRSWKHLPLLPDDKTLWSDPKVTGAMSAKSLREKYGEEYFAGIAKKKKFKKHCETCTCSE